MQEQLAEITSALWGYNILGQFKQNWPMHIPPEKNRKQFQNAFPDLKFSQVKPTTM